MATKPNFSALWTRMVHLAEEAGDSRLQAVLANHADRRERICRKLGVVSAGDIQRIREHREGRRKTP